MSSPSADQEPPLHSKQVRLSYADCDPAGILYYAAWFPWMERVQSEWFFLSGLRQDTLMERFGFGTVTRHTECEYLYQVGLFHTIDIELRLRRVGNTSVAFESQMLWQEGGTLAARGVITLVCVDHGGRPVSVPPQLQASLSSARR